MNRASPRVRLRWAVILLSGLAGCGRQTGSAAAHLFTPGDAPVFSFDEISSRERLDELSLLATADASSWTVAGSAVRRLDAAGLEVHLEDREVHVRRTLDLDASAVDGVEVFVERIRATGWVELDWSARGESASSHAIRLFPSDLQGSRPGHYAFELRRRPEWKGRIVRLDVRIGGPKNAGVTLRSIELYRRRLSEKGLRHLAESAVTATLDGRAQPALVLLNGASRRFDFELPRAAELELSVAGCGWSRAASRLRWSLRRLPDTGVAVAAGEVELSPEQRWIDLRLDLSAVPPGAARLEIESEIPGETAQVPVAFAAGLVVRAPAAPVRRPNVLVVSIDTLRADHLSLYGYARRTSPAIDAWAAAGALVFEQAFTAAPMTLASHASLFTGLGPLKHGAIVDRPLSTRPPVLAERFRAAGYATLAVTGGGYLDPRFGLARGFDRFHYLDHEAMQPEEELAGGVATARGLLREYRDRPFLLFFHTYEVHSPYSAREPYYSGWTGSEGRLGVYFRGQPASAADGFLDHGGVPTAVSLHGKVRKLDPGEYPVAVDAYDSGVAAADHAFGELLQELTAQGLADDTIVVVLSDHGESLGEHGLFEHGYLYDDNLRVALAVHVPGESTNLRRIRTTVRLLDLFPTLLDLAGLAPEPGIDGESLTPFFGSGEAGSQLPDRPVVSYAADSSHGLAIRARGWKWIFRDSAFAPKAMREELYDLHADAAELRSAALEASAGSGLAALRDAGFRALADRRGGVRVRVRNPTALPVTVEIGARGLGTAGVKMLDRGGEPWVWNVDGTLSARIDAGRERRLLLLPPLPLPGFEIRFLPNVRGIPDSQPVAVPMSALCARHAFTVARRGLGPAERRPSVLLEVDEDCADRIDAPLDDETLVRHLRALGYLR